MCCSDPISSWPLKEKGTQGAEIPFRGGGLWTIYGEGGTSVRRHGDGRAGQSACALGLKGKKNTLHWKSGSASEP